jgi:AcrR family transcriptional regulator
MSAALTMFADRGFHGTNVPDLAREAAVGAGSVYRHFADKEALVNTLYQESKKRMQRAIMDPPPELQTSFENQFLELWGRLWKFYRRDPATTIFLDVHAHGEYLSEESLACSRDFEERLIAWIRAGQSVNALRKAPPEALISMVYGAFIGLIKSEIRGRKVSATMQRDSGPMAWQIISP